MIIQKYGIELHRLTHDDIELVRQARNRIDIREKMFDQQIITEKQQDLWFHSINNMHNYYFVIHYQGEKVGLIGGKNLDYEKGEVEAGMFIWENDLIGTSIPAKASIIMIEFTFEILGLARNYIHIRPDNLDVINYNVAMGYRPAETENCWILDRQAYDKHIHRLRKLAAIGKVVSPLSMNEINFPNVKQSRHLYEKLPDTLLALFRPKLGM